MNSVKRPINIHKAYHAHVYFDVSSLTQATHLCQQAGSEFGLKIGRVHEKLVGPHPRWSCQILFGKRDFDNLIPWLEANRQGLSILVHAQTGNDLQDHTEYAYWLGDPVELNLSIFQ